MKYFGALVAISILIQVSGLLNFGPRLPRCGENEIMYSSSGVGSMCSNSCKNNCTSEICTQNCDSGCFCKPGWKKDGRKCVLETTCPRKCAVDEIYVDFSGNHNGGCRNQCENKCLAEICPFNCEAGCFCQRGFYKDIKLNKCVRKDKCPKSEVQWN